MTADSEAKIEAFLAAAGWSGASRRLLADDASFRYYDRVTRGDACAVLMVAPPPKENVAAFQRVTSLGSMRPRIARYTPAYPPAPPGQA